MLPESTPRPTTTANRHITTDTIQQTSNISETKTSTGNFYFGIFSCFNALVLIYTIKDFIIFFY